MRIHHRAMWVLLLLLSVVDVASKEARGNSVTPAWTVTTREPVWSGPATSADGATVFVGSNDQKLYALNAVSGEEIWSLETGGAVESAAAVGEDGTVFCPSWSGYVYAVDGATGSVKWKFATLGAGENSGGTSPTSIASKPAIGLNGTVYVTTPAEYVDGVAHTVYAINGSTGTALWTAFAGAVTSSPALSADGAVLYVSSNDGYILALDTSTGQTKWMSRKATILTDGYNQFGPAAVGADGTVYASNCNGYFYALDGATGKVKWKWAPLPPIAQDCMNAKPAIAEDGTIFLGTAAGITALDAGDTGASKKWSWSTLSGVMSAGPTIGANGTTLYVGTIAGGVYALDIASDGATKWHFVPENCTAYCYFTESVPAVVGGLVVIGSDDGSVYALNA